MFSSFIFPLFSIIILTSAEARQSHDLIAAASRGSIISQQIFNLSKLCWVSGFSYLGIHGWRDAFWHEMGEQELWRLPYCLLDHWPVWRWCRYLQEATRKRFVSFADLQCGWHNAALGSLMVKGNEVLRQTCKVSGVIKWLAASVMRTGNTVSLNAAGS